MVSAIHSILEDEAGNLWISTNQGLVEYNVDIQKSNVFNKKKGVVSNEFNDNASLKIETSQFYFGG